jgi:ABC-type lipoprotein release transport system permease subunit
MALMQIAFAGFKRYKNRRKNFTVILIGSFFLICIFMLFFSTAYQNIYRFWIVNCVGGDIIVSKNVKSYDFLHPVPLERNFNFHKFIINNPSFKGRVSPCLRVGAVLASKTSGDSVYCIVNGIDRRDKKGLVKLLKIQQGRIFNNNSNEVLLPRMLAFRFGVELGDTIMVFVIAKDGYYNFDLFKVAGFLNISLPAQLFFNQAMVYMPMNKLRELVVADPDQVSEAIVFKKAELFGGPLKGNFQQISAYTSFTWIRSLFYAFCFIEIAILLLVFVMAFCSIYHNVGLMNVEREKEIGIYLASGAKPFWIRRLMFYELLFYSIYCSLWGGLLSLLVVIGVNNAGIYPSDIPTKLLMACLHFTINNHLATYILSFIIILLLMIFGSIGPIWRATENTRITELFQKNI